MGTREHLVGTADYWFRSAQLAHDAGDSRKAYLCMENAYNHLENAFVAVLRAVPLKDDPPHSGRERKTFAELRAMIEKLGRAPNGQQQGGD